MYVGNNDQHVIDSGGLLLNRPRSLTKRTNVVSVFNKMISVSGKVCFAGLLNRSDQQCASSSQAVDRTK